MFISSEFFVCFLKKKRLRQSESPLKVIVINHTELFFVTGEKNSYQLISLIDFDQKSYITFQAIFSSLLFDIFYIIIGKMHELKQPDMITQLYVILKLIIFTLPTHLFSKDILEIFYISIFLFNPSFQKIDLLLDDLNGLFLGKVYQWS